MKMFVTLLALVAVVGVFLLPALAQGPKADPGPEQDGMARMMGMMSQMQEQMQQMQEQMKGMQGMGPMQGGVMGQMNSMMQQHRAEMQKLCPGAAAPQPQQKGG